MIPSPSTLDELQDALRQSQEQYRSLVESMDLGYILVDVIVDEHDVAVDLLYVEANAKAVAMTGTVLVGRRTRELSADFEPHWFETFGRVARTGVGERHEFTAAPLGVWYDFCVFKVGDCDTRRVVALYQDVTERKRGEAALRESEEQLRRAHAELESRVRQRTAELALVNAALEAELQERRAAEDQIKALFAKLVTVQEEERRRMSRDIHDQLGQQMTALRLQIEALRLGSEGQQALSEPVGRAGTLAEELDQSIDFLTGQLRPAALDHLGLSDALAQLVSSWSERFRIHADYRSDRTTTARLRADVETNVYRLAQEALHNIYKHAGASRVTVSLEQRVGSATLIIADNGRGFDTTEAGATTSGGLGLINMRERAALAGGELRITSRAGMGTTVIVSVVLGVG